MSNIIFKMNYANEFLNVKLHYIYQNYIALDLAVST